MALLGVTGQRARAKDLDVIRMGADCQYIHWSEHTVLFIDIAQAAA